MLVNSKLNILVTGGAGFIASHLCDALLVMGHFVDCVDDLSLGVVANIAHLSDESRFRFFECDLNDSGRLNTIFKDRRYDLVFHLAANSDISRSRDFPNIDFDKTFRTTYSVLDQMRINDVKNIVFSSTSAIYGELPGNLRESEGPLLPISHYGAGKLASEAFISSFSENYGMKAWIFRFPNVVGPRATHGVIFDFLKKLNTTPAVLEVLGDGTQEKPYLYVDDLIRGILLAVESTDDRVNLFNIGNTSSTTVAKIAQIVLEELGSEAKIAFTGGNRGWIGDVPRFSYDLTRIHALGWRPTRDSDTAIRQTARYLVGAR